MKSTVSTKVKYCVTVCKTCSDIISAYQRLFILYTVDLAYVATAHDVNLHYYIDNSR